MNLDSETFDYPRPRPPRSSSRTAQIRQQNRRRQYLLQNPSYFSSREHEFADPLLYDLLIRRFLTPQEREAEGRAMGYARVLEGSLVRGEERLQRLARDAQGVSSSEAEGLTNRLDGEGGGDGMGGSNGVVHGMSGMAIDSNGVGRDVSPCASSVGRADGVSSCARSGRSGRGEEIEEEEAPKTKEDGHERWEEFLRERFIRGEDEDFEYGLVDEEEGFDVLEREEMQDAWFDQESPDWADDDGGSGEEKPERILTGETGVQDF